MSYSFGWWDFVEVDGEQQMVCRDSDERVVMVRNLEEPWLAKAIAVHPKRPADRWKRFEYRHEEFWFPLIVNWVPEEGRILVDYNLSSELWRQETNADTEYPPYGGWVRVDDMVPDAFWCWPGILEQRYYAEPEALEPGNHAICYMFSGGWHKGNWVNGYFSLQLTKTSDDRIIKDGFYSWDDVEREAYGVNWDGPFLYCKREQNDANFENFLSSFSKSHHHRRSLTDLFIVQDAAWVFLFDEYRNLQKKVYEINPVLQLPKFEPLKFGLNYIDKETGLVDFYRRKVKCFPYPILINTESNIIISFWESDSYRAGGTALRHYAYYMPNSQITKHFSISQNSLNQEYKDISFLLGHDHSLCPKRLVSFEDLDRCSDSMVMQLLEDDEYLFTQRQIAEAFHYYEGFARDTLILYDYEKGHSFFDASVELVNIFIGFLAGRRIIGRTKTTGLISNVKNISNYYREDIVKCL